MMIFKIKVFLRNWADKSNFGSMIFQFARKTVARLLLILPDKKYAQWFYKLYTGKSLDLENPRYFDEKVWWLKLNNRDPLLTTCSDKHLVREYVKNCGFEEILIPQVGLYNNAKEIPFKQYKEEVIIKCTSGSGENFIYSPTKDNDTKMIIRRMNYALKQNPFLYSREWNYKNIENKITVEKIIRDKEGKLPLDYKFMCFDGEPKLLFLDIGLIDENNIYNHHYPRNIYDMDFNLMPFKETRENYDGLIEKPENFEKMIEIAKKLSEPFPFCRIDLYNLDGKIYFGEITFYHGGGCNDIQPEEWDLRLGSWIDIENPKIKR
ncbi:MAG: carboxylate--amine ligase [Ruminococcaceae bacterium]|nr:carboxylate--amine ligase [Oscillospiraceae bacterium]